MQITKSQADFAILYDILVENFPLNERRNKNDFLSLCNNSKYCAYAEKINDEIVGFIGLWEFDDFVYIEYFATKSELHGKGLGSKMLLEHIRKTKKPICLEVEPPTLSEIAFRRVEYYKRMGFKLNPYPYMQPPYSPEKEPVELLIMTFPDEISQNTFGKYKKEIYKEVYKK